MSLIQEALKRQQMELEGQLPPPVSPLPPSPPVPVVQAPPSGDPAPTDGGGQLPSQEKAEGRRITPDTDSVTLTPSGQRHRVLPSLAAVLLVLLVLTGAVVWALMYGLELAGIRLPGMNRRAESTPVSAPAVSEVERDVTKIADAVPVSAARITADAPPPAPAPKSSLASTVKTAVSDASTVAHHADEVMTDSASSKNAAAPVQGIAKSDAAVPAPRVDPAPEPRAAPATPMTPAAATDIEPMVWPNLSISGVLGNEQKGAAFIDGKVVGVNETIQGVRILAIRSQSVMLEYKGESRLVKVGQSVNRSSR